MARHDPVTIDLGAASFTIRPLTLGQVEAIETVLLEGKSGAVGSGIAIVGAALSRDHAQVDLKTLDGTALELSKAVQKIINMAFETTLGEIRPAGQDAQTSGATSEAASSPVPA